MFRVLVMIYSPGTDPFTLMFFKQEKVWMLSNSSNVNIIYTTFLLADFPHIMVAGHAEDFQI